MRDTPAQSNILDQLRRITLHSWAEIEESNGWSYHMNIGLIANQAADEIERLRAELSEARAKLSGLCQVCGEPLAATALHEYCADR